MMMTVCVYVSVYVCVRPRQACKQVSRAHVNALPMLLPSTSTILL